MWSCQVLSAASFGLIQKITVRICGQILKVLSFRVQVRFTIDRLAFRRLLTLQMLSRVLTRTYDKHNVRFEE